MRSRREFQTPWLSHNIVADRVVLKVISVGGSKTFMHGFVVEENAADHHAIITDETALGENGATAMMCT